MVCVYCGVENVLGVDLRHRVADATCETRSLEGALRSRRRQRIGWRSLLLVSLAMIACSGSMFLSGSDRANLAVTDESEDPATVVEDGPDVDDVEPALSPDGTRSSTRGGRATRPARSPPAR